MDPATKILILTGSSASGKTSVAQALVAHLPLTQVITTTTRPFRRGERNRRDYYFVSLEEFKKKLQKKALFEWTEFAGEFYGSTYEEIERILAQGKTPLFVIDPQGAFRIKKLWPQKTRVIFLVVGKGELERRLKERGDLEPAEIKRRLSYFAREQKLSQKADFRLRNARHQLKRTISRAYALVRSLLTQPKSGSC